MHNHQGQDLLIIDILLQIANEKEKSLDRIKHLLLIEQDPAVNLRFWELLDMIMPGNTFQDVGCCPICALFELRS